MGDFDHTVGTVRLLFWPSYCLHVVAHWEMSCLAVLLIARDVTRFVSLVSSRSARFPDRPRQHAADELAFSPRCTKLPELTSCGGVVPATAPILHPPRLSHINPLPRFVLARLLAVPSWLPPLPTAHRSSSLALTPRAQPTITAHVPDIAQLWLITSHVCSHSLLQGHAGCC